MENEIFFFEDKCGEEGGGKYVLGGFSLPKNEEDFEKNIELCKQKALINKID